MSAQFAQRRALSRRGATLRTAGGLAALVPYFFWVPYIVIWLRPGPEVGVPEVLQWVGVVLSLVGIVFSLWAMVTLGRHYDLVLEVHQDHELVRRGPYRVVRHPLYTGLGCTSRASVLRPETCSSSPERCSSRFRPSTCAPVPKSVFCASSSARSTRSTPTRSQCLCPCPSLPPGELGHA